MQWGFFLFVWAKMAGGHFRGLNASASIGAGQKAWFLPGRTAEASVLLDSAEA
jgi:hypothetical protein